MRIVAKGPIKAVMLYRAVLLALLATCVSSPVVAGTWVPMESSKDKVDGVWIEWLVDASSVAQVNDRVYANVRVCETRNKNECANVKPIGANCRLQTFSFMGAEYVLTSEGWWTDHQISAGHRNQPKMGSRGNKERDKMFFEMYNFLCS